MRRALLLILAALPLAAFDCGDPPPTVGCQVTVSGAVSETLWCAGNLVDLTQLDPPSTGFSIQLALYRGAVYPAGNVSMDLPAAPDVGTVYGWDPGGTGSNVDFGDAVRPDAGMDSTHEAYAPDTGKLSLQFSALPPVGPGGAQSGFHGTLTATLPPDPLAAVPATSDIVITATF